MNGHHQSIIELARSLDLFQTTLKISHFPHVQELKEHHLVYLSETHYVFVKKDSSKSILTCHEIVYDKGNRNYIPVENSLFSLAKLISEERSEEFRRHIVKTNAQIGISTLHEPVKLGEEYFIFMKKIDNGVTFQDALSDKTHAVSDLINCLKRAMQDALFLRNTALILHIDIKSDNIMFPSGRCIDFEYCAYLPSEASRFAYFPEELNVTKSSIGDFCEDLDLSRKMFALDKNKKVFIDKFSMDYLFHNLIDEVIRELKERELSKSEDGIIELLKNLRDQLSEYKIVLEEAIIDLDDVLRKLDEKKVEKSTTEIKTESHLSMEIKSLPPINSAEFNQLLKKLQSGLDHKTEDQLLELRQEAHEIREKLLYQRSESQEIKFLKASPTVLVIQEDHIQFLENLIEKHIEPKLGATYRPPLGSLYGKH